MARLGGLLCVSILAGCGARTGVLDLAPRERPDAGIAPTDAAIPDAFVPEDADRPIEEAPPEVEPAVMVAAGLFHTCAATAEGRVQCWGFNNQGQVGDGTSETRLDPVPTPGVATAIAVTAGRSHSCALLAEGTVRCWGSNLAGQVGDGSFETRRLLPADVIGLTRVAQVAAGGTHTCARLEDGRLYCWGDNDQGQVGPDERGSYREPVPVPLDEPIAEVSAGFQHTCVVGARTRRVRCWGEAAIDVRRPRDEIAPPFRPTEVPGLPPVDRVTSGDYESCAIAEGGLAWCWGFERVTTGEIDRVVPRRAEEQRDVGAVSHISAGHEFRCAVGVWSGVSCWGNNDRGQLGDGGENLLPGAIVNPLGLPSAEQVSAGWRHACALVGDGRVFCWGRNAEGQLGDGRGGEHRPPVVAAVFRD